MAKILTFPMERSPSSLQQPVEKNRDEAEFVVFESDELLSFSCKDHTEHTTYRSQISHDRGWSNQELASIYRVKHLLDAARMPTELDRGISDEGEPWCVFCNSSGEVFIHLSRIDGLYWLDSPNLAAPLNGCSFDALVSGFTSLTQEKQEKVGPQDEVDTGKKLVRLRSSDTLLLHPSVMLAALVWSLYFGSEEILLFAPQNAIGEDEAAPEADAVQLLDPPTGYDSEHDTITASSIVWKDDDASWHELQKSLLAAGSQSHLNMMLGLGSIAVASGLVSEGQWKDIFASILRMVDGKDIQTASGDDAESDAYVMSILTQSIDLVVNFILEGDTEYAGDVREVPHGEADAVPTSLIVTKLAELFQLDEPISYADVDFLEIFQDVLKANAVLSDFTSEQAVLEGQNIFLQEATDKDGGASNLPQSNMIMRLFDNIIRDSDFATFEFGGEQYLADSSLNSLNGTEAALLGQVLNNSEKMLTGSMQNTDSEPLGAFETPVMAVTDPSMVASRFPAFDDRVKDLLFDIVAREDVNFIASPTSLIFFDLGAYGDSSAEISKMTWTTDDGIKVSLLGSKADFMDYGFV